MELISAPQAACLHRQSCGAYILIAQDGHLKDDPAHSLWLTLGIKSELSLCLHLPRVG